MNGPSFFSRRDVGQDDPPLARLARGHLLLLRPLPCLALGAAWFTFMYKKTPGETPPRFRTVAHAHASGDTTMTYSQPDEVEVSPASKTL